MNARTDVPSDPPRAERWSGILLIDDDTALLAGLAEMLRLRLWRVRIDTCDHPTKAVTLVQQGNYDLILCDVHMPQITGIVLLPELRQAAPDASIVMMSGVVDDSLRSAAFAYGATMWVAKPFDRQALTITLKQVLKNRRLAAQSSVPAPGV